MSVEMNLNSLTGAYVDQVIIVEWHRAVGEAVCKGDPVVTVESRKVTVTLSAPCEGVLLEQRALAGEYLGIEEAVAIIG